MSSLLLRSGGLFTTLLAEPFFCLLDFGKEKEKRRLCSHGACLRELRPELESPHGILPEVLVYGGRTLISFLLTIFNLFWRSDKLPSDLIDAIICILFKKGDRSDCGNYRGISLLNVVGKIFADIVLQRLKRLAELVYPESQSGYRDGRVTIDGIFILRQMMEK